MLRKQAYKFEVMPNGEQVRNLRQFAGSCRFVYNKALALNTERYINKGFDPRKDDCWALGCILYEFISGRAVQWADEKGSKTTLLKHFWDMENIGRRYLLQMRESVERTSTPGIWRIIEGLLSPESERWSVAQAIEALNEFKLDFMR